MKIVINTCFGGFGLSDEAIQLYGKIKKLNLTKICENKFQEYWLAEKPHIVGLNQYKDTGKYFFSYYNIERDDPALVHVVEHLGKKANGEYANLKVVEIPNDIGWSISDYDGVEHISENHRSWS